MTDGQKITEVARLDGTLDEQIAILSESGVPMETIKDYIKSGYSLDRVASAVRNMAEKASGTGAMQPEDSADNLDRDALMRFHLTDARNQPTGVFDLEIFQDICEKHNLFIMGGIPYIYRNGVFKPDYSGAELKTMIRRRILPEFVKSTTIRRIYDLFLSAAELQATADKVNNFPPYWINFVNSFYDPLEKRYYPHDPKYRAINQIPHFFDRAAPLKGNNIAQWIQFAIPDKDNREMLLQYCGLCLTTDTRQQKCLLLNGMPGSGKSTLIRLLEMSVGADNVSNVSLSELGQRFAAYGLMGRLLNSCADLEVGALEDVSLAKKLLGEDAIRAEAKGKDAVSFHNYAKMIFSTNELPLVKAERTNGFFRRLLILDMNIVPDKRRADFFETLSQEVDDFILLCVQALERMHSGGGLIAESESSKKAVTTMRCDSDTVEAFLTDCIYRTRGKRIERGVLFDRYATYCFGSERQSLTRNNFFKALRVKGFSESRDSAGRYFNDVAFEKSVTETVTDDDYALLLDTPTPFDGCEMTTYCQSF